MPSNDGAAPASRPARRSTGLAKALIAVLAVLAIAVLGVRLAPLTTPGRQLVESHANGLKLGPIGHLKLEGLSGDIWRDFSVRHLAIADAKGVWLEAHQVRVNWVPGALLTRRFQARAISARDVIVMRRPVLTRSGKGGSTPISVSLDSVRLRLITRPAFSGKAGDFDVAGAYRLARQGGQGGRVSISSRQHLGDHLRLSFDLGRKRTLKLDADAVEANGGAIAGALGLPVDRPFDLKAKANGAMSQGQFSIVARTGPDTPLDATGTWTPDGGSARGRLDLRASTLTRRLEHMFGPEAAFSIEGHKATEGLFDLQTRIRSENLVLDSRGLADLGQKRTGPAGLPFKARIGTLGKIVTIPQMGTGAVDGTFRLEKGGFSVEGDVDVAALELLGYRLARARGPALVRWSKGELTIKADAVGQGGGGSGVLALLGAAPKAQFEGLRLRDGQFLIRSARITAPNLVVTGEGQRGILGGLSFKGDAQVASLGPVRPGATGRLKAVWTAGSSNGKPWDFTGDVRAEGFAAGVSELDRLLGTAPRLTTKGNWYAGVLSIADARLEGDSARVHAAGRMTPGNVLGFTLDWTADGPFRAGPLEVTGKARGDGTLSGTLAAPRADLTADFDTIDLPKLALTKARLVLTFARTSGGGDGVARLTGDSVYGPARGGAAFSFAPGGLDLTEIDIDAGGAKASGAVSLRRGRPASADLQLAVGPGAFLTQGRVAGSARIVDAPGGASAKLDLMAEDLSAGSWKVRTARIRADGAMASLPLTLDAQGVAPNGRWRLGGSGNLSQTGDEFTLALDAAGKLGRTDIKTRETARLRFGGAETGAKLRLAVGDGQADIDAEFGGEVAELMARLTGVSLTAFDPDLAGDIDGAFNLRGQGDVLNGDFQARLTGARERGARLNQSLDARIQGNLKDRLLSIDADGSNPQGLKAEAHLVLPTEASARPLRLAIDRRKAMQGTFLAQGEIKPLWDLLLGPERSLSGKIDAQGSLAGTLADPRIVGRAALDGGAFEEGQTGLRLKNMTLRLALADNAIDVSQATGEDGKGGTVFGGGRISLNRDGISGFKLELRNFQLIDNDLASASATGQATINRSADGKIKLTGALVLDRADVSAQSKTPAGVVSLDVVERNRPPELDQGVQPRRASPGGGVAMDITLKAPRRVFVRGRGLDVELSLEAHVGGTSFSPILDGTARVVRGEYDFAGKRFEFDDSGVVTLATQLDRIRLNLSASRQDTALTAVVRIQGTAAKPEITLTSTPELPNDEVLSQVLFGASAAQLSPIEAAQLASALAALAGGGGFDVIGNLRSLARLDRLAFAEGATGMTVAGGKYVTDDVYLEIIGGGREGPEAQVEWRIRKTLSLVSRIGGQGDAKLSVRWRKDYQ
ncbi:translocation/assembly module TamB domain-containing protein [Caulobacter sp. HMWF025]|uniref:translocation/assembly module TamB domain-containing protein n=2 Tax=unclassified Caulobacter TaxID=2648921 RepID=UPI000D37BBA9|nr:translocation/assembly module TamB domain-containing protein [Caulobacter sp. HMWF025]PTT06329.1 autotransporter [Caulobacter sp. HMWF025]